MSTYDFLIASNPDQAYVPERYINPKAPPINLAASWLPLQLAWIFDKCNLYNPHILVSKKEWCDEPLDPLKMVERHLQALERHDHQWDVVEFRDVHLSARNPFDGTLEHKNYYQTCVVIARDLPREEAERKIHQFNLDINLKNADYTNQLSPDL